MSTAACSAPLPSTCTLVLPTNNNTQLCTDMSSSSDNQDQDLKYPPVQIDHSLHKLDLDTLIMRSTSRRLPDEAGSSLDDSTFEILGLSDSLIETSDDEAHTESIASTDGYTPDDASSFSDDEDADYTTDNQDVQQSTASLPAEAPEHHHDDTTLSVHSVGDSTMTEVPMHRGDSGHSHGIHLEEQVGQERGVSQASKVVRSFPDENGTCYSVFDGYECSEVRVVVRAALSDKSISTPDSYRIMYVGMPDKWDEDMITTKISAALTACPSTSRSIMVQGQLEPYGPIMHVSRCTETKALSAKNEPARVALTFDNGEKLIFGPGRRSALKTRPDLVIFCHPTVPHSDTDAQGFTCAREVLNREQVPYIELTSVRQYHHGIPSYDSRSLSVCMEGRNDPEADFDLKEVLPIDHFTFNDLEPSQINRHLALISPHMVNVSKSSGATHGEAGWKSHKDKSRFAMPRLATILLSLISAMVAAYYYPVLMPALRGSMPGIDAAPATFTPYTELCSSLSSSSIPVSSSSAVSVPAPSVPSTPRGLSIVPPQAKPNKQVKKKAETLVHYKVQTTDNHQFTLVPTNDMLNVRKKPQLQIQVSRQTEEIPIRFNRTISGVYVVDLEQQHPFGLFNVSIASFSKPLLQQTFEIALGHNKTMLDQLFDTKMWKISDTRGNIFNYTKTAAQELQAKMSDLKTATRLLKNELKQSRPDVTAHLQSLRETFRQLGAKTAVVQQVPEVAWVGVRDATAPIRRSSLMSKLRMRAIWLRCETEKAAGASSRGQEGKKSWACSKLDSSS
jgi:hypothetical protein